MPFADSWLILLIRVRYSTQLKVRLGVIDDDQCQTAFIDPDLGIWR
jgi:hypothetical protein